MHTRDACNKLSLPLPLPPPSPPSPSPPAGQWAEGLAAQSAIILRLWSPKPSHAGTQPPGHTKAGAVSSSAAARAQAAHTHIQDGAATEQQHCCSQHSTSHHSSSGKHQGKGRVQTARAQETCLLACCSQTSSPPAQRGWGEILIVHQHQPRAVPIDPLSHSQISSFDNTRAAQELRSRIQSKRRRKAWRCTGAGKHSEHNSETC